jgi:hypothetical protein
MVEIDYGRGPRPPRLISPLLWVGLVVLVLGSGPLVAIIVAARLGWTSDPNPNPVGPGILAFFTFWPGVALCVAGAVVSLVRWRRRTGRG